VAAKGTSAPLLVNRTILSLFDEGIAALAKLLAGMFFVDQLFYGALMARGTHPDPAKIRRTARIGFRTSLCIMASPRAGQAHARFNR
jgi:hypothetical protein